jgi:hypothetical protein
MIEFDEFGLFMNIQHIDNFLYYMNALYNEEFNSDKFYDFPRNEISFIYMISHIFEYSLISDYQNFKDLIETIDFRYRRLDSNQQEVVDLAFDLLKHSVHISDMRKIPEDYGVLIKNAIDILAGNYDVILTKQFEVVSIARIHNENNLNNDNSDCLDRV